VKNFQRFLEEHPMYRAVYDGLLHSTNPDRVGRVVAASAQLVYRTQGEDLGPVADEILNFVDHHYPQGYLELYLARVTALAELQRQFDRNPSSRTLGDPNACVDRDDYSLSLLLSIVFTNHRFEIMAQLFSFLKSLAAKRPQGHLVAIGVGTGYELVHAARILSRWKIEAYDTDYEMRTHAKQLWEFFQVSQIADVGAKFPLERLDPTFVGRYDSIIMCELCEHLRDPLCALRTVREYLKEDGRAFVTMAVNIAQEDHIFLYPTIESCRAQLRDSGLYTVSEWITPQAVLTIPANREETFQKGNYIAAVQKHPCDEPI
jgi:SAM-dependent methyltransferase